MTKYSQIAIVDSMTPKSVEYYEKLKKAGVNDVIVTLSRSGYSSYSEIAEIHTDIARRLDMRVHAALSTDLRSPFHDARHFFSVYKYLGYNFGSKTMIMCHPDGNVKNQAKNLHELLGYISYFVNKDDLDVAISKDYLDEGVINLEDIPDYFNLTVINPDKLNAGVDLAGTWIYKEYFEDEIQLLGYDYYGFYTGQSNQLTLDTEYVAQEGDTWVTIATRYGVWLPKLLDINDAKYEDLVVPGQHIKLF